MNDALLTVTLLASVAMAPPKAPGEPPIDYSKITSPIMIQGDEITAHRDPAAHYHEGVFRVFHTLCRKEEDGYYWYLAVTKSTDLVHWSKPRILTPRDRTLNYSSPGNVVRLGDQWVLCLQTYPEQRDKRRIWQMTSRDLEEWSKPELLRVKGPDVSVEDMGKMIDPYLLGDKDKPGRWWCFYKQNGMSMSSSDDGMKTWTYRRSTRCGENVCVLVQDDRYLIVHAPKNGIGIKESKDLKSFKDVRHLTLGQDNWPWAQGRMTAAMVLDLREDPRVGKYLMFFHGSTKAGKKQLAGHGRASLALAWSDDLVDWRWGGQTR